MTTTVDEHLGRFNGLPHDEAVARLLHCCAWAPWAEALAAGRPYATTDDLDDAAAAGLAALSDTDLPAILSRYNPIAVDSGAATTSATWSRGEEAGVHASPEDVKAQLVAGSAAYQERFGYTFLIAAAGLSGAAVLDALRARLDNDATTELGVARRHLDRICRARVQRLLGEL